MEPVPHTLELNQKVQFKEGMEDVYSTFIPAKATGWVRALTEDNLGYPFVMIEWDPTDWRYNQQPDGLMMEAHFEPLEEKEPSMPSNDEQFKQFLEFQKFVAANGGAPEAEEPEEPDNEAEEAKAILAYATDALSEAEGYLIFVIKTDEDGDPTPEVVHRQPKSARSRDMLNINIVKNGYRIAEDYIIQSYQKNTEDPS